MNELNIRRSPAIGQRDQYQPGLGWPDSRKVLDLGGPDAVSIDLPALPAA